MPMDLPQELLELIFVFTPRPGHLAKVNRAFAAISRTATAKARWLLYHHGGLQSVAQGNLFHRETAGPRLQTHLSPAWLLINDRHGAVLMQLLLLLLKDTGHRARSVAAHHARVFALELAAQYGFVDCCALLLSNKSVVAKWYPGDLDKALMLACVNGHLPAAQLLLDAGADLHADNEHALRWSCYNGYTDVVQLLLQRGADVAALEDHALFLTLLQYYRCLTAIALRTSHTCTCLQHQSDDGCPCEPVWQSMVQAIRKMFVCHDIIQLLIQHGASAYRALQSRQMYAHQFTTVLGQLRASLDVRSSPTSLARPTTRRQPLADAPLTTPSAVPSAPAVPQRRHSNHLSKQALLSSALLHPYSLALGSMQVEDLLSTATRPLHYAPVAQYDL
ncbi:hypothetical protein RI367_005279 [Sorochytrium milnesiophthora]